MATRERQQIGSYPTPLPIDLIFFEVRDSTQPKNKNWNYGDRHPNLEKYPNHVLVLVVDESNRNAEGDQKWYYAANRENQDLYNWAYSEADIGGVKFDSITRTYITPRVDFSPSELLMGAAMPNIPEDQFPGTYVLSERRQVRTEEKELDSLFVFDSHVYINKQPLIDIEINRETGDAQQIITNYYYRGEVVIDTTTIEDLVADETNSYWDLDADGFGNVAKQLSDNWWEVSQRQWVNLWDIWEWELDKRGPRKFYCPSSETTVTEVTSGNTPGPYEPLPDVPVGQMVKITKWGGYMRYTTVTRDGTLTGSIGEEYGDIVTKTVTETLVPEGSYADAGMEIVSSVVEKLECDIYVKQTKSVKGGAWPEPLDKQVTKDASYLPPARYRKDLSQIRTSRKIPTAAIPDTPSLNGNEIAKVYKKETPDRAEEVVTIENFTLNVEAVDESVEQRPFVKITSRLTPGPSPVLPETGNGSAKLVYEGAETDIYENVEEIAEARPGLKGIETDAQQWGKIVSTTNYTTSNEAPDGGSVRLIFDDGAIKIYEATTTAPEPGGTTKDIDPQNWGLIQWEGVYDVAPSGVKSRQVWSNGEVSVFLNETPTLTISGTKKDIDPQNWGSITWNGVYAAVAGGVRSNQVYSGPGGPVFLNETPEADLNGTNIDIDLFPWGAVKWNGVYASTTSGDRSRQVFSMGDIKVFLNETAELIVNEGSFVSAKESNPLLTETQTTSYGLTPTFEGNGRSRVVYSVANKIVYENVSIVRVSNGSRTYAGVVNVDLPPIYQGYTSTPFIRRDGANTVAFTPILTGGYRGPMPCEVTEYWTSEPGTGAVPTIFRPTPMEFRTPLGGFAVGECLHGEVILNWTTGTTHRDYAFTAGTITYPATEPASWVGLEIIAGVDSQPYQDGYVVREYRVQL